MISVESRNAVAAELDCKLVGRMGKRSDVDSYVGFSIGQDLETFCDPMD